MGKKSHLKSSSAVATISTACSSSSSIPGKTTVFPLTSSTSTVSTTQMGSDGAQMKALLDSLAVDINSALSILNCATDSSSISEFDSVLKSLETKYLDIALKNRITRKQDEALAEEVSTMSSMRDEASHELLQVREQFFQAEAKVRKLENLSKTLSFRVKSIETKANEDVKFEKEERLKLSYEFSGRIKDISCKLDELSKRRETIVAENLRLRQILKTCLDELDHEDQMDAANQAKQMLLESNQISSFSDGAHGSSEKAESKQMEMEEDISRIMHLREKEELLQIKSAQFMDIFDSFQTRLTESNQRFRTKQAKVEELTKEIQRLEKSNRDANTHIAECIASAKAMTESVNKIKSEKDRYIRMIDKQHALIEKFQSEIAAHQ